MLEHRNPLATPPRRAMLLGAAGFVAGAIRRVLAARGIETVARGAREHDLLAPDASAQLAGALREGDALVIVAARAPCKSAAQLVENARMIEAVCGALAARPVAHLVYVSSDAVYGDVSDPIHEGTPAAPADLHGVMHRARELMLASVSRAALAILRPSLLYGADDPHNGYGPNRFRRNARESARIQLFGGGEEKRDHVLIDDLAELAVRALEHQTAGILNVATGTSTSFREVAERVAALCDGAIEIAATPRQNPITHRHFDVVAVHKAFPDFRFTPLAEGLERAHQESATR